MKLTPPPKILDRYEPLRAAYHCPIHPHEELVPAHELPKFGSWRLICARCPFIVYFLRTAMPFASPVPPREIRRKKRHG